MVFKPRAPCRPLHKWLASSHPPPAADDPPATGDRLHLMATTTTTPHSHHHQQHPHHHHHHHHRAHHHRYSYSYKSFGTGRPAPRRFLTFLKTLVRDARALFQQSRAPRSISSVPSSSSDFLPVSPTESSSLTAPILGDDAGDKVEENGLSGKDNDGLDGTVAGQGAEEKISLETASGDGDSTVAAVSNADEGCSGGSGYVGLCRRRMTSITPVSLLWSLLSILVASACGLSFFHPYWIVHPDRLHSFGLFTQCVRDTKAHYPRAVCKGYGPGDGAWDGVDLGSIPAGAWQASTLLYGSGVALECVGAAVTLVLLMIPSRPYSGRRLALLNGYLQTVAVLIMLAGLLMFPLGFSTPFFQYYCDSSRAFCVGHCRMGWSYVLAITATALAIFCPVLSNYTDMTFDKETGGDGDSQTIVASV